MKSLRIVIAIALLLPACSCVPLPSFYPLWDEQHGVLEPRLLGEWRAADPDDDDILRISEAQGQAYVVTLTENENGRTKESCFDAHLVRLGEHLFLDFVGNEQSVDKRLEPETYQCLVLMHFFARVELDGDTLKLAILDDEMFEKKVARKEMDVPLLKRGDTILLAAETAKIQEVLSRFAEDQDLWGDGEDGESVYIRVVDNNLR